MTLEELENIRSIQAEINGIKAMIREIDALCLPSHDQQPGSRNISPGNPTAARVMSKITLEERLQGKLEQLIERGNEVESWLDTVDDQRVRIIVRSRYLLGHTWERVAKDSYLYAEESTPRKYLERYLQKQEMENNHE